MDRANMYLLIFSISDHSINSAFSSFRVEINLNFNCAKTCDIFVNNYSIQHCIHIQRFG
jgi:hypothetical protein